VLVGIAIAAAAALVVAIYALQYHGRLGPRRTEQLLMAGTQTRSVHCVRGWRVGLFSHWSYVTHWTYACTFDWKRGLGPPERLGVRVNAHEIVDSEIG